MLSIDPEREAAGRNISAMLVAKEIKQGGPVHLETILTEIARLPALPRRCRSANPSSKARSQRDHARGRHHNGEKRYFSDTLNWIVFEKLVRPPYSIWAYVLDAVPQASRASLPEMEDIVSHAARTIGTFRFGVPRLRAEHAARKTPHTALAQHWTEVLEQLQASARGPSDWPYDLAFAARWQMLNGRDHLALPLAAKIVMEAAIPMSKVDPATVPGAWVVF